MTRSLDPGGAERQLVTVAKGLAARGWEVRVLVFYGGGMLEEELRRAGVPIVDLGKSGRWDVVRFAKRLVRELRAHRPQVLHAYLDVPNLLASFSRMLVRDVKVVWGVRASDVRWANYGWLPGLVFHLNRLASRTAHLIVFNSRSGMSFHLAHGYPRHRSIAVDNGIDTDRFRPLPQRRAEMRARFGIAQSDMVVALIGRLDPMKGHETFIRAAALLQRQQPSARFLCIGRADNAYGRKMARLVEEARLSTCMQWLPRQTGMPEIYCMIDVVVSSSSYGEGFPRT